MRSRLTIYKHETVSLMCLALAYLGLNSLNPAKKPFEIALRHVGQCQEYSHKFLAVYWQLSISRGFTQC